MRSRRLELLDWAHAAGTWVLERDDNAVSRAAAARGAEPPTRLNRMWRD